MKISYYLGLVFGRWYRMRYWRRHKNVYLWGLLKFIEDTPGKFLKYRSR